MATNIEQTTVDELTEATSINENDYLLAAGETYDKKTKISTLLNHLAQTKIFSALTTTAKNIVGAINELNGKTAALETNTDIVYDTKFGGVYDCPHYYNATTRLMHISLYLVGPVVNETSLGILHADIPTPSKILQIPFLLYYTDGGIGTGACVINTDRSMKVVFDVGKPAVFVCVHADVYIQ